ncbi:acyl-CoA dehydrogenase family protein [Nocardia sp. AG03]|uniref:acyl-CoA dehydrogenase family protein n=1 Tax=Nocardia sp. AG03 TaxID=3025312 RepID=UPI0024181ACC|nr:acyl-CoA dehydrogenase family protein [Nocardia sp. AG03]
MDFTPTEAQLDLARLTGEICAKLVTADRLRELDTAGRFDDQLWKALADAGVLAAALPEDLGGSDFGALEQTAILRELGKSVAAVPVLWSVVVAADALARFGDEDQRALAARAGTGEIVLTAALAEPLRAATDAPGLVATESDGWTVTGTATTVAFADRAERILVPATVSGRPAVFVVDPAHASVTRTAQQVVDLAPEFLVEFSETPAELLGTLDTGAEILTRLREQAWLGLAALQLGTLERALELTAEHTRTREQFGKPLGAFQAVAQRLSDAYIDINGLRLAVTQAAWRVTEGLPATESVHIAKFWAAEAGHKVAHTVIHIHGGLGIDRDHIVHNYFTAAKHHEFALGGATPHLLALGAELAR